MGAVVTFEKRSRKARKSTEGKGRSRPWFARCGWWVLASLCSIVATYLKALHPIAVFIYWTLIVTSVGGLITSPLLGPHLMRKALVFGASLLACSIAFRYGGEALQRSMAKAAIFCRGRCSRNYGMTRQGAHDSTET